MKDGLDENVKSMMLVARAIAGKANLMATLLLYREGKISVRDACVRLNNAGGDSVWLAEMLEKALEMATR
jgi:hypothetical protein